MSDIYSFAFLVEATLLITTDIYLNILEQKNTSWFYLLWKMPTNVPQAGEGGRVREKGREREKKRNPE